MASLTTAPRMARSFRFSRQRLTNHARNAATATISTGKKEGTIADAFASLSGQSFAPLEPRFADLKRTLIHGHEDAVKASWKRLLDCLNVETKIIAQLGSKVVPEIKFEDLATRDAAFDAEYRKRGVAVIRNVVPEQEALQMKEDLKAYIKANPQTKGTIDKAPRALHYKGIFRQADTSLQHFLKTILRSTSFTGLPLRCVPGPTQISYKRKSFC